MHVHEATEDELFGAIEGSGARALLIGRRAMVAIGFPVLTADYDFWIHIDDIEAFNGALRDLEMLPTQTPEEARKRGRYVIENGEHIDVLVARSVTALDGDVVCFEDIWAARVELTIGDAIAHVPSLGDLIRTKRFSARDKHVADLRMLLSRMNEP